MHETSVQFGKLELALAEAEGLLSDLPPHDVGGKLEQLKLKSYVLICHAAIEEYLEQLSLSVLSDSLKGFQDDRRIRGSLLTACSYYRIVLGAASPVGRRDDAAYNVLLRLFEKAIAEHAMAIDGVHGVKTKDQNAILLPIGVNLFEFDRLLSQGLNSFGSTRGKFAHGLGFKLVTPRAGLERTVRDLFRLLLPLDNMLCERHQMSFSNE